MPKHDPILPLKPAPYDPTFHVETFGDFLQFHRLDATPFTIRTDLIVGAAPHPSGNTVLTLYGASQPCPVLQPYGTVRKALARRS